MNTPHNGADALVSIRNLRVAFDDGKAKVPVLHGIDLDIDPGEALGIVGESGCGKSVTWLAVLGLLGARAQVSGTVYLRAEPLHTLRGDQLAPIRGKRIAMIFQDPSCALNPVQRIGRQLTEALTLHRALRGAPARAEALRLLDRVHIPDARQRLDAYPHELSGGMNQRVMIAMALAGEPELLVADEPTTALDTTIQAQILALLAEIRQDSAMALVLISHDLGVIADMCDRVLVMYAGRVVEQARSQRLFQHPQHPYTQGLLGALPDLHRAPERLVPIAGNVPEPAHMPRGCSFGPRCRQFQPGCELHAPVQRQIGVQHHVACHRAGA
ncbi:ABC transporter ATP-binding protein [Verminephrobacter eiseniae]|uniref:Oligopeptide/dipeptide ABC transporter, ATPase subunit n=1 Tax=Verminephrobacter eiseniae (strain EF01-2) TaxID=391735 RepID=A1WK29_VEREI|nr:ABC transporter ATP-binding protein [Verminephrobacter eiseniae]KAB7619166.1 ABC transporter ATP-binding protein [Verminephrobacter sp. Larva24]ABM57986.1 oligopeptide/dipeptide ABC transporter, ATPase subunit [Verminephrobacter eiseniae EF01-2]MCW5230037.1 ABC transporter ATP-binding protein [Verminephrobacter eiseniae]MCW5263342.1 ABC transporter ATP-binding protein [Verminephrobacter eiseniae]MCW5283592.1 ABC transporter ATP-binding protein [Verminephrobacter eiseniae]